MYRIDNSTAADTLPTPAAVGVTPDGYFTKGDVFSGIPPTVVNADWANAVQEEIAAVIEGAGLSLSKTVRTQLLSAIGILGQGNAAAYAASTTAANTYTATMTPAPTAYTAGQTVYIKFTNHNTGAATINLNGLGAKAIKKLSGAALSDSDIGDGMIAVLSYDGTNFQLLNAKVTTGLAGVTDGSIAAAGQVGQIIESIIPMSTPTAWSNAVALNLTSISATAGSWMITGQFGFQLAGGNNSIMASWISTTSATLPADYGNTTTLGAAVGQFSFPTNTLFLNISSTTTVYLSGYVGFPGTCSVFGNIKALRVR